MLAFQGTCNFIINPLTMSCTCTVTVSESYESVIVWRLLPVMRSFLESVLSGALLGEPAVQLGSS